MTTTFSPATNSSRQRWPGSTGIWDGRNKKRSASKARCWAWKVAAPVPGQTRRRGCEERNWWSQGSHSSAPETMITNTFEGIEWLPLGLMALSFPLALRVLGVFVQCYRGPQSPPSRHRGSTDYIILKLLGGSVDLSANLRQTFT